MISGNELAAVPQMGWRAIVLLFSNGIYSNIRMHQERGHPKRVSGTTLKNQNFVKMPEGLGAHVERATKTVDFAAAFTSARDGGSPAQIELATGSDQISTLTTTSKLRDSTCQKANA